MPKIIHEVWYGHEGQCETDAVIVAGPHGDQARSMLPDDAVIVHTFEAETPYEAMQKYYDFRGFGEYKPSPEWGDLIYNEDGEAVSPGNV